MAEKVLMLALSPTMETGSIVKWEKSEGDQISTGDILCEVETDKATMEYESVNEGTLLSIVVPENGEASVGQTIAVVGEKGEKIDDLLAEIESEKAGAGGGTAAGEETPQEAAAADTAGKQAPAERPSSREGTPASQAAKPAPRAEEPVTAPGGEAPATEGPGRPAGGVKASPLARTLADRYGLNIGQVPGSGPDGRVVKRDVEAARAAMEAGTAPRVPSAGRRAVPAGEPYQPGETPAQEEAVSRKRAVIAQRLAESKYSAPDFYEKIDIDVGRLMEARRRLNESRQGDKVSFNAYLLRFTAEALRRHPVVNSSWKGDAILRFGRADIGLAVAQPDGLITPVVRDCWNRTIPDIDRDLKILIDRARSNRLKPEEYTGATFTVSSLGSFGIHEFTAIINPPGSAILAVGEARKIPVVTGSDDIDIVLTMTVTMSCDHRVIDGAEAALFLRDLKGLIEDPYRMLY